jgi:hypothetical protein
VFLICFAGFPGVAVPRGLIVRSFFRWVFIIFFGLSGSQVWRNPTWRRRSSVALPLRLASSSIWGSAQLNFLAGSIMSKDKLGEFYIRIHEPKMTITDFEMVEFIELEARFENGHSSSEVEAIVRFRGTMDSKLEFKDNSI